MNNEGFISSYHVFDLLIHDLIKPRKFNCVFAVSRGISSALPRCAAEFTKFAAEFVKFCRGKLWALLMLLFLMPSDLMLFHLLLPYVTLPYVTLLCYFMLPYLVTMTYVTVAYVTLPYVTLWYLHSFIHSGHFYSAPSIPLLLRGAPDYSTNTVSEFHPQTHTQLH